MILTRTPFRVSFAGGGSDLPEFYHRSPGAVLSCTIDKAMYIAVHPYFHDKIRIKYSRTEDVASATEVEHPLVRECLNLVGIERGMEIASFADVPAEPAWVQVARLRLGCCTHSGPALAKNRVQRNLLPQRAKLKSIGRKNQLASRISSRQHTED